ncbi:MMPL family transporter [Actinomadura sp. WMMA1423]|uniref:MMPL family transporter n=1 Tax=Actinomadura sp. WMMA1423 TaxID=2591108 RepID=UPI00143D69B1|nr:MMPL family transporter [Actinomadura sp. WMMA1423]
MLDDVAGLPKVGQVRSPYQDTAAISEDGTIGYATVVLDVPSQEMPEADTQRIFDAARKVEGGGLRVELGGRRGPAAGPGRDERGGGRGLVKAAGACRAQWPGRVSRSRSWKSNPSGSPPGTAAQR